MAAALQVIGDLLDRLVRDLRDTGVRRPVQLAQEKIVPGVEQKLPRHGESEIAVLLFEKQQIAEFTGVAQIGELVGVTARALDLAGQTQPEFRLPDQVERHVRERRILLQKIGPWPHHSETR